MRLRGGVLAPVDAALAALAMLAAHALSPVFLDDLLGPAALVPAIVHALAFVLVGQAVGLYEREARPADGPSLRRATLTSVLAPAVTLAVFYLVFYRPIGRWVVVLTVPLSTVAVLLVRLTTRALAGPQQRRVLLLGDDPALERTRGRLDALPGAAHVVVDHWREPGEGLVAWCIDHAIDDLVMAPAMVAQPGVLAAALACLPAGCRARTVADFHEDVFREVLVDHVDAAWLLAGGWDATDHVGESVKRGFDLVLAAVLLVATAPVVAAAALAVKLADGGPVFFTQERVGRFGRVFRIVKLRTMAVSSEGQARWTATDDPRVTRVGRVLRHSRVDELPQLVDILAGHMSFVGPRPEQPEFVRELERSVAHYAWRHVARPGLTGWAQIRLGYAASVDDARRKLECDLYYLRRRSFLLDLLILLRTAGIAPRGAR